MKIGIQTWGSEGDIRPMVALATGLADRGHRVTLAVAGSVQPEYGKLAERHHIALQVSSVQGLDNPDVLDQMAATWSSAGNPLRQAEMILASAVDPAVDLMTATARELCAASDLVIGHFFVHPLHSVAERTGVPLVTLHLAHTGVPSAFLCPPGFPSLGRLGHRLGWALTRLAINRVFLKRVNQVRACEGLTPLEDVITQAWASPMLTLIGVSRCLCPRPPDWPPSHQVCGFLEPPAPEGPGPLAAPLQEFLDAGEPPVYFTFGSLMPQGTARAQAIAALWREAARQAGVRAILQLPSAIPDAPFADGRTFIVIRAPHAEVFPHCAVIVHHGGAGTVHATLRAGVPSVVVPHVADQFFWAAELRRLGVAGRAIARPRLRASVLARAIRKTRSVASFTARARELRPILLQEHGVGCALNLIEGLIPIGRDPRQEDTAWLSPAAHRSS